MKVLVWKNNIMNKNKMLIDGLNDLGSKYPDSFVVDMLTNFSVDVVLKFMTLYSGRTLSVPKIDFIWKSYRNKIIIKTLLVENNKVIRLQLAEYFGISPNTVRGIFYKYRNNTIRITNESIIKVVETIFRKNSEKFNKRMKAIFSRKYGIEYFSFYDSLQNPEDIFLLKEARRKLVDDCKNDIKNHPIFIGREHKIKYANKKIVEKIDAEY